jgi:hypothetical protein
MSTPVPGAEGRQRVLWLAGIVAGFGLMMGARQLIPDDEAAEYDDAGDAVLEVFRSTGRESTRRAVIAVGGLVAFACVVGLVRSGTTPKDPALEYTPDPRLAGGGGGVAGPGAQGPVGGGGLFAVTPGASAVGGVAGPGLGSGSRAGRGPGVSAEIDFDPTQWQQPAGLLWTFEGRSATGFYDLICELGRELAPGSGILVAMLRHLQRSDRRLVVLLGSDGRVADLAPRLRARIDERRTAGSLDWERIRPDAQFQAESYDPAWRVDDASAYHALRRAIRQAEFMALAAVAL